MLLKGLYHNFYLRIAVFILLTIAGTYLVLQQEWVWFVPILSVWSFFLRLVLLSDKRNAQKVAFMFDAIDNSDYAFRHVDARRTTNWLANRLTASRRFFSRPKRMPPRKKNITN